MNKKNVTGIILAGGKSTRMNGMAKGLIKVDEMPIIERLIQALKIVSDEIIIISNDATYQHLGLKIYSDEYKNKGPLGGIHSALVHSNSPYNLVVGCDMPFLTSEALQYLVKFKAKAPIVVAEHQNWMEPLCAIYHHKCLPKILQYLRANQLKMMDFIEEQEHYLVDFDTHLPFYSTKLFQNLNSLEDLNSI